MRIIAGKKKGMTLLVPKTRETRPITDRVKESIFNILFNCGMTEEKLVADVFSGVGSFGLEALSRGARGKGTQGLCGLAAPAMKIAA